MQSAIDIEIGRSFRLPGGRRCGEDRGRRASGGEVNEFRRDICLSDAQQNASPAVLGFESLTFGLIGETYKAQ